MGVYYWREFGKVPKIFKNFDDRDKLKYMFKLFIRRPTGNILQFSRNLSSTMLIALDFTQREKLAQMPTGLYSLYSRLQFK